MTQSATIAVYVGDWLLKISGSEEFVHDQLDTFSNLIVKHLYNMLKSALEQEVQGDAWKSVSEEGLELSGRPELPDHSYRRHAGALLSHVFRNS